MVVGLSCLFDWVLASQLTVGMVFVLLPSWDQAGAWLHQHSRYRLVVGRRCPQYAGLRLNATMFLQLAYCWRQLQQRVAYGPCNPFDWLCSYPYRTAVCMALTLWLLGLKKYYRATASTTPYRGSVHPSGRQTNLFILFRSRYLEHERLSTQCPYRRGRLFGVLLRCRSASRNGDRSGPYYRSALSLHHLPPTTQWHQSLNRRQRT